MTIIYILLLVAAAFIEISDKCNTDNAIKKIGLTFVMVGCILQLANRSNDMIAIGLCMMLGAELLHAYFHKHLRRKYDKGHV